jgi:hypothetical protein
MAFEMMTIEKDSGNICLLQRSTFDWFKFTHHSQCAKEKKKKSNSQERKGKT